MTERRRPRAVVVGATFGAIYAEALATADSPVELIAVVSTGSPASAALAGNLGVALCTDVADLPDADIAFVVVRSGVVGGDGVRISEQLLARGVHVMQEQPVHADEILSLLRVAKSHAVQYAVNDFYSRLAPVRQFVYAARALDRLSPIRYVHARSSIHVAYPLFTILCMVIGPLTPARMAFPGERSAGPFVSGRLILGDVSVDLLIQNELCPTDPDNHARLMHAITVGSDAGELVLTHTHGSTRWHPRPRAEAATADSPVSELVGVDFEPTAAQIRNDMWPAAIRLAAADFLELIDRSTVPVTQRFVRAVRLWSDFTSAMGPATRIDPQEPKYVSAHELT
ncbi:Gfo/Idh/MocA family oxidoreductase [Mycobacterium sp. TY815]|uniref:Gfo/Idh/MocA family oxidoreductase n=1 Tax=Mycobacterium sp. TY815 TaxID=3050581 RepID=UPI002741855F|nr:Gfo/Idh/MocA family oxidoreductase [Mycobacterium sp. TY815]MDP7705046.1 Gfo/Idh/MocA family oxidoreductase [Mycobacterium sp. TY815]